MTTTRSAHPRGLASQTGVRTWLAALLLAATVIAAGHGTSQADMLEHPWHPGTELHIALDEAMPYLDLQGEDAEGEALRQYRAVVEILRDVPPATDLPGMSAAHLEEIQNEGIRRAVERTLFLDLFLLDTAERRLAEAREALEAMEEHVALLDHASMHHFSYAMIYLRLADVCLEEGDTDSGRLYMAKGLLQLERDIRRDQERVQTISLWHPDFQFEPIDFAVSARENSAEYRRAAAALGIAPIIQTELEAGMRLHASHCIALYWFTKLILRLQQEGEEGTEPSAVTEQFLRYYEVYRNVRWAEMERGGAGIPLTDIAGAFSELSDLAAPPPKSGMVFRIRELETILHILTADIEALDAALHRFRFLQSSGYYLMARDSPPSPFDALFNFGVLEQAGKELRDTQPPMPRP